jgi:hypothetical protein
MAKDKANTEHAGQETAGKAPGRPKRAVADAPAPEAGGALPIEEAASQEVAATEPAPVDVQAPDPYPNKHKYEDGYVFNLPVTHWEKYAESEIREMLVKAGNEHEYIDHHVALIKEAAKFHGVEVGNPELVAARQGYEASEGIATRKAFDAGRR